MRRARVLLLLLPLICSSLVGCQPSKDRAPLKESSNNLRNFYEIYVGAFADSDGDGVGDLKGVQDKLDYISDLGFDGIWLMPIFESPSYHKYDTEDYFAIDPDYGTEDDLKSLVSAAHERGIKVIIDLALNHSSTSNQTFQDSLSAYAYTLGQDTASDDEKLSGMSEEEIQSLADMYSFSTEETSSAIWYQASGRSFYYEGNFSSDMPEWNFDSQRTQDYFRSVIQYWMSPEHGDVDGYRLDAVSYYYLNDTERNTAALDLIESYGREVDPDCYFVGECWKDQPTITDYYEGSDLDSFFWFPAQSTSGFIRSSTGFMGANKALYAEGEKQMLEAAGENIAAPFLDNHDTTRMTLSNLVDAKFQYGLLATLSGNTFTYYGDECGIVQSGTNDESKRTHMPWGDSYECSDPANASAATFAFGTVKDQLKDEDSLVNTVAECNRLRNLYPALGWGEVTGVNEFEKDEAGLLSIDKELDGEKVRVVYNFDSMASHDYVPEAGETLIGNIGDVRESSGTYALSYHSIAIFAQN